jgi:flagellar basal-body rod modification protein FlgD
MSTIDPTSAATFFGENVGTEARLPVKSLDQEDFLKLLVAQMTSQDPLNPKTDIEMIPQLVSFSTLAQSQSMQADIASLRAQQAVLQANSLLGRTVYIKESDDSTISGRVDAVSMQEGTPKLVVNGQEYGMDQLLGISPTPANDPAQP